MSGGYFDYNQNRILYIIEDIERLFDGDVRYNHARMTSPGEFKLGMTTGIASRKQH